MAIQPSLVQYEKVRSEVRMEDVEVSRVYDDGFLLLKGDPGVWIQSNPDRVSSVRSLELYLWGYEGESIGDSIGELSQLTHLCIWGGRYLKCLPNILSTLYNLHQLEFCHCYELEILPANLGDLKFLTSLFLGHCNKLRYLPWSIITKLSKLRYLNLPEQFRLETLPPHLNDSIIISVDNTHIRKTWKELKTHMTESLSFQFPIISEELVVEVAQKTSTPGYLQYIGDPTPWIHDNYDLHSSVRILDLNLWTKNITIPDSIGELPQLTHLYITGGCLPHHLPPLFTRLTHLSLIRCTFKCNTVSHFDSLGNLTTLKSLHLCLGSTTELPEHMDLPISLRHLALECFCSEFTIFVENMAKLSNLNTLILICCDDLESLPLNLNLTKLILRETTIKSLPIGLKHLELIHDKECNRVCNELQECWNQLVNLETLSCTCYAIESLSSVTSLHNLQELQLKDCFSLKELPQHLYKLVKLCTLNVSGTRIKSLPTSITKLPYLRQLILPKCVILESLPCDFGNKVMISVDDTDEIYYKYEGYHDQLYETLNEGDYMTSDCIKRINEKFLENFKQATVIEQASPHRPLNHLPYANRIMEGSHFSGSADPTCNNNHNAFSSSLTQEMEILPTGNEDQTIPDVVDEFFSNSSANTRQDHAPMEIEVSKSTLERGKNEHVSIKWPSSRNRKNPYTNTNETHSSCGRNLSHLNSVDHSNPASHSYGMEHLAQPSQPTLSYHVTSERNYPTFTISVSRSTLQRRFMERRIIRQKRRKRKNPDTNRSETHSTCGRNLSQLNSVDASKPASHGQGVEHLAGPSHGPTLSYHVSSEHNAINDSTPDIVTRRTIREPPLSTQCRMDSRQHVEEYPNVAKELALLNTDLPPNERCSTFAVKATFNEDIVRFSFSLSSSIKKLKEVVGKKLDLEVGTFKIKYQDDEKDWVLMADLYDLELALNLSKASGSNFVRLSIELKT